MSNAWNYFLNKTILEGEIKDAKMSSFSSDLNTLINFNFLWIINEFENRQWRVEEQELKGNDCSPLQAAISSDSFPLNVNFEAVIDLRFLLDWEIRILRKNFKKLFWYAWNMRIPSEFL